MDAYGGLRAEKMPLRIRASAGAIFAYNACPQSHAAKRNLSIAGQPIYRYVYRDFESNKDKVG